MCILLKSVDELSLSRLRYLLYIFLSSSFASVSVHFYCLQSKKKMCVLVNCYYLYIIRMLLCFWMLHINHLSSVVLDLKRRYIEVFDCIYWIYLNKKIHLFKCCLFLFLTFQLNVCFMIKLWKVILIEESVMIMFKL